MLRVISYNIHSGRDLFLRKRLTNMADTLLSLDADVIGLQETHQNSRFGYQTEYLADRLGYQYAFAPTLQIHNGGYGNALLTRLPLLESSAIILPAKKEPRCILSTSLTWREQEIDVWVTHCSLNAKSRASQIAKITQELTDRDNKPLLLLGDFNTNLMLFPALLQDCAEQKERHHLPTLSLFAKRLDYIFASYCWTVEDYQVIDVKWSDHYPVLSTLKLKTQPLPAE